MSIIQENKDLKNFLDNFSKHQQKLSEIIEQNKYLSIESPDLNLRMYNDRAQIINMLRNVINISEKLIVQSEVFVNILDPIQSIETEQINKVLDTKVTIKRDDKNKLTRRQKHSAIAFTEKCENKYTPIKITDAHSINAITVPSFDYVQQDGNLYFVIEAEHFAFKIAGKLFHGNIGDIYTDAFVTPSKIKNCKYIGRCDKGSYCNYYHNPRMFPGSKDYRNFISTSFLYIPAGINTRPNVKNMRRFGSRANIDLDIFSLQPEEIERFHDQVTHDLLCAFVIDNAYDTK
jgi:hypothetical protein